MAYNYGFPATYQQMYYQPQQPQQQQQNGRIWVQGEAGAKSYLVAPGNTIDLWDSESPVIYIKSADASGLPAMKVLDYTVRDSGKNTGNQPGIIQEDKLSAYATKAEIDGIYSEIKALRMKLNKLERKEDDNE